MVEASRLMARPTRCMAAASLLGLAARGGGAGGASASRKTMDVKGKEAQVAALVAVADGVGTFSAAGRVEASGSGDPDWGDSRSKVDRDVCAYTYYKDAPWLWGRATATMTTDGTVTTSSATVGGKNDAAP